MIDVTFPLGESYRSQAGRITCEAFRRKLQPLAGKLRIAALAVDAAARGRGVGSLLLGAIFGKARRSTLEWRVVR